MDLLIARAVSEERALSLGLFDRACMTKWLRATAVDDLFDAMPKDCKQPLLRRMSHTHTSESPPPLASKNQRTQSVTEVPHVNRQRVERSNDMVHNA